MSNLFIALVVPVGPGIGASVDTSALGSDKSIVLVQDSSAAQPPSKIVLLGSNDAGATFVPIWSTENPTATIRGVYQAMCAQRINSGPAASCRIGAEQNAANVFATIAVPTTPNGVEAFLDSSGMGSVKTLALTGPYTGTLSVEGSNTDGSSYESVALFNTGGGRAITIDGVYGRLRARAFSFGGSPVLSVGTEPAVSGSGAQGAQGAAGAAGAQGFQGFQGTAGTGAQGSTGAQGAAGTAGAQGFQGFQGTAGTGAQGSTGAQGAAGTAGAQGSQGFQGTAAAAGPLVLITSGTITGSSTTTLAGLNGNVDGDYILAYEWIFGGAGAQVEMRPNGVSTALATIYIRSNSGAVSTGTSSTLPLGADGTAAVRVCGGARLASVTGTARGFTSRMSHGRAATTQAELLVYNDGGWNESVTNVTSLDIVIVSGALVSPSRYTLYKRARS